jgi:head-tail adaptor
MAEAALARIEELERDGRLTTDDAARLREMYEHKREHAAGHPQEERERLAAEREVLVAQRDALIDLRERGEIDNTVLRQLQRSLDIAEERLRHASEASGPAQGGAG